MKILYENRDIIVCIKPIGVLSEESDGAESLPKMLSAYLVKKGEAGQIFTVHRLDAGVGGVMVYAKNKNAAAELSRQIQERTFEKEYLAVVEGIPTEASGSMTDLLFRDSAKNKSYVVKRMRKGVKEAKLDYELLASVEENNAGGEACERSLVKILLHTGRTHQIRVQFSSRNMPLCGDKRYGSRNAAKDSAIALFSYRLTFKMPNEKEKVTFSHKPSDSYPWNLFDIGQI